MAALGPALAGCEAITEPVELDLFADEASAAASVDAVSLDAGNPEGYDLVIAEVPGFAGFWWDRRCNLHVNLVEIIFAERVIELLEPRFRAYLAENPRCPRDAQILVHQVQYSWQQLREYLGQIRAIGERIDGVVGYGIDIPANKIVVSVTGRRPAIKLLEALPSVNVPTDVVKFVLAHDTDGRTR
jgi:hypothetical protein